jgi:hypothetical protein
MARKRETIEGQASLFDPVAKRASAPANARASGRPPAKLAARTWHMPELQGRTIAEIRLRWTKRLTPAQVARVEAELSAVPQALTQLGFGPVQVEHAFVRRRRG